jgi:signal transduction histidine kinase
MFSTPSEPFPAYDFVATVSHDLRTPLTSIEASLTLLACGAAGELPQEAATIVRTAENEIGRLRALVNDLLDVAKIKAGKMRIQRHRGSLKEVINQAINVVKPIAEQREIKIEYNGTDAIVLLDSNRFVQVIINLLSNAVKYSPDRASVEITLKSTDGCYEIRVTDCGPGIHPTYQESIFRPYTQGNGTAQKEGTGLGLTIAQTIIEEHGGKLGVQSSVGKGSTFWVHLPI